MNPTLTEKPDITFTVKKKIKPETLNQSTGDVQQLHVMPKRYLILQIDLIRFKRKSRVSNERDA